MTQKRIMVIDDSVSLREVVGISLRGAGYEVTEACDGKDALAKLNGSRYHLMICDVNMPVMDVVALSETMRMFSAIWRMSDALSCNCAAWSPTSWTMRSEVGELAQVFGELCGKLDRVLGPAGAEGGSPEEILSGLERNGRQLEDLVAALRQLQASKVVKEVKQLPRHRFVPIIMLTTESRESRKTEGQLAGAKAWVVKPFRPDQMLQAVAKLILP